MGIRRRWELFVIGGALVLALVILVSLGTFRSSDPSASPATSDSPSPQASPATSDTSKPPAPPTWMRKLAVGEKPPQFVLFSFDGAGSHEHWQKLMPIARKANAHFSGFLSGIYLLSDAQRGQYTGPGHAPGKASIAFGGTDAEVTALIGDLNMAVEQGHEIGTHYNGHFCQGAEPGVGRWNAEGWTSELDQFFRFFDQAKALGLKVDPATVKGGRTPCLEGKFDVLFPILAGRSMTYDTSQVSDGVAWPYLQHGVWEFPMPTVKVPGANYKKTIMMDYNLWFIMNKARNEPGRAAEFEKITYDTYQATYQAALAGNRAPLVVGNHFNGWSGGGFAKATERFMADVCTQAETACATYTEVIDWMKLQDPAVLESYRAMPHAQVAGPN